jgi:threonine/homoserine/homoserine lactone efflux protein
MIGLETYFWFVGASLALVIMPGPDMAFLLGQSVTQGRKAGAFAAMGINVGAYVHLMAALLGLSAILFASSVAFNVVKWAGACYLVWMGLQAIASKRTGLQLDPRSASKQSMRVVFWQGFLCDVLNPKVALFYVAFLPQFVDPDAPSRILQLIVLGVTLNVIAIIFNLTLVQLSGTATATLRRNPRLVVWLNRALGVVFISLGIQIAREKL